MTEVRHTTIKRTNYIPTYQLQEKNNHHNKNKRNFRENLIIRKLRIQKSN